MKLDDAREFWRDLGVPEEAIEDLWDLAEAVRFNDAQAEEAEAIEGILTQCGWHPEAAKYMSRQRAMRLLMRLSPEGANALRELARKFAPAVVSGLTQAEIAVLGAAWIDGFTCAARAAKLREENDG